MSKKDEKIFTAWVGLIRTIQSLSSLVEENLKQSSLPPLSWYDVLLEINREDEKRLRLQDIGQRILLAKNNVTRLVDRLEKESLVSRKKCGRDGRGVYAYITPKGEKLLELMWPVYRDTIKEIFSSKLSSDEIEALISIQTKLAPS